MTDPSQQLPAGSASAGVEAALATLARGAAGIDPAQTITPRSHLAATLAAPDHSDAPVPAIPELPLLAVAAIGTVPAPGGPDLTVTGVLGEGGMGRVLLARQRSLGREVALKVVRESAPNDDVDRLLAEALVTGALEHPSIVPVHALGLGEDGRPVMVMKRIEGVSWAELGRAPDHPAWAAIASGGDDRRDGHLEILMAVCNAVHFAHSRGIVHRDLKPDNVMIGSFGEVYVVDWGIATLAARAGETAPRRGPLVGTPAYLAPEMVRCDLSRIDARTDVYLLGATLHALLTGRPRHDGAMLHDVLLSAAESRPFAYGPDVPAELAAICNRAAHADPAERFPTALALRRAVADHRLHRGAIAMSDAAAQKLAEHRALVAAPGPRDERRAHALLTESRFGFMQSLGAWRDNEAARRGLQGCLAAMIEHELDQRDAAGARQLLGELPEPRPDLAGRIEALEADLRETAAREARLRALERDQDLSVGARSQLTLLGILVASALGVAAFLYPRGGSLPSHRQTVIAPALIFAVFLAGAILFRKGLGTAISRRTAALLLLIPLGVLLHRISAAVLDAPIAATFAGDLWLGAALAAAIGIAVRPGAAWAALPFACGAAGSTLWPERCAPIFASSLLGAMVLLLLTWARSSRRG